MIIKKRVVVFLLFVLNAGLIFAGERSQLQVTFLNVKGGNAIFIVTPSGSKILVDSGDGSYPLMEYLTAQGVKRIDMAVITCPTRRNMGGFYELLTKGMDIGEFVAPELDEVTTDFEYLMEVIMAKQDQLALGGNRQQQIQDALNNKKHYEFQNIGPGTSLPWGQELQAVVLGPYKKYRNTRSDLNNNSLVMKISYGTYSFLLTGNIAKEAAMDLTKLANKIQATVLQIPDNGNGASLAETFFQKVSAKYAVCQPVPNQEPSAIVFDTLKKRNAMVLQTKEKGSINFSTDGLNMKAVSEK